MVIGTSHKKAHLGITPCSVGWRPLCECLSPSLGICQFAKLLPALDAVRPTCRHGSIATNSTHVRHVKQTFVHCKMCSCARTQQPEMCGTHPQQANRLTRLPAGYRTCNNMPPQRLKVSKQCLAYFSFMRVSLSTSKLH